MSDKKMLPLFDHSMKRQIISQLQNFGLKPSQVLRLVGVPKSSFFYRPKRPEKDRVLAQKIKDLAFRYPSFGYRRIWALPRKEGLCVNQKRVRRIYKELHLELPVFKPKRRSRKATKDFVLTEVQRPGERWSKAFTEVRCEDGYRIRILNFIDDASRYFLGYLAQRSILGRDAARFLGEFCRRYGPPRELRRDDGPEFRSRAFQEILGRWRIKEVVIPPGSPYSNGQLESPHSTGEIAALAGLAEPCQEAWSRIGFWSKF